MAHIHKRGVGKWRARYRGPDGRERSKTFRRRVDAERFLATVEADKLRGHWVDPTFTKVRFGDYANEWMASITHVRPTTFVNIEGRLRNHILPTFEDIALGSIRPGHIRVWVAELGAKGLSAGTVASIYRTLSKILRTAEIDGFIARSPCIGIELPREHLRDEMHFLSHGQVGLLAGVLEDRYKALIYSAAYTGLRWGELAALKRERVNPLRGTINVMESLSEVNGYLYCGPTKTGANRTVSLPRFLSRMLQEHMGAYPCPEGYVFTSPEGGPLRRNFYRRHYKPAVRLAGLPEGVRFHDLRHTCAALLIAQGAHPKEIQERLGHSTIRMTFDRYGHLFPNLDERLREGLDAGFRQAIEERKRGQEEPEAGRAEGGRGNE